MVTTRSPRRAWFLLLAVCLALAGSLAGAGQAAAHAVLRGTDPQDGSVLGEAPRYVTLTFSEDVRLPEGAVRVLDPQGTRMDTGEAAHAAGRSSTARASLRKGLASGTYTVAWRVVSADSHPVSGAFTFSVGKPSATSARAPVESPQDAVVSGLYGFGRFAAYGGVALLVGTVVFMLFCRPDPAVERALRRLVAAGWWVLTASTTALLTLRGAYEAGDGLGQGLDPGSMRHALGGRPGQALAVRLVILVLAAVAWRIPALRRRRVAVGAGAVGAIGLAATWAVAEHASVGRQVPVAVVSVAGHLLGMAVWLGGLAAVLVMLRSTPGNAEPPVDAVRRFSRAAFTSVCLLVATGVYQSWREVGSWQALSTTGYGQLLMVKMGVVLALLVVAGYSRRWTARMASADRYVPAAGPVGDATVFGGGTLVVSSVVAPQSRAQAPGLRCLRRSVGTEAALGVAVLAVTTVLTGTVPARTALEGERPVVQTPAEVGLALANVNVPFDTRGPGGKGRVNLAMEPGRVGRNSLRVVVFGTDDGLLNPPEVKISLTLPSRGIGPLEATLTHEGAAWLGDDLSIPFPGKWRLAVTVRTSDIDQVTVTKTMTVPGLG